MPRVLLVSHFFPPIGGGGVYRALGWTRHLPEFGWDVTVLAADADSGLVRDDSLLALVPASTEVLRVGALTGLALRKRLPSGDRAPSARGSDQRLKALARFVLLPDSYRPWAAPAIRAGRERIARGGIDAVISTSPPETSHQVGEALARGGPMRLPWIADFRDPWVGLHYRTPPTAIHRTIHAGMERRVFERADLILCASQTHERAVRAALGTAGTERVIFHPNGTDAREAAAAAPAPGALPTAQPGARVNSRARIVFTGHVSELPALDALLDGLARRLAREPALRERLEVALVGPFDAAYAERARAQGLDGVVAFAGNVTHEEALRHQREAGALLLLRNEGTGYAHMVPGKLYEYLEARRPLVAMISEGEAAELARTCGAVIVPPADGDRAVDALLEALSGGSNAPHPNETAIAKLFEKRSRRALASELAGLLDRVTAPPARSPGNGEAQRERRTSV
ncbi:MAG: glycosyltransferase [Candidatus Eiseniibacteriota bacterium]